MTLARSLARVQKLPDPRRVSQARRIAWPMVERPHAILFDAGNTLLEPVTDVPTVYWEETVRLGIEIPHTDLARHLRRAWESLVTRGRAEDSDHRSSEAHELELWHRFTRGVAAPFPDLLARHEAWLASLVRRFEDPAAWRVIDGAHHLLEAVRNLGIKAALVSNWGSVLRTILGAHSLDRAFDAVIISAEVGYRKPHPEMFLRALNTLGATADRAWHVGDSWPEDVRGATDLGIRALWLHRGTSMPTEDAHLAHRLDGLSEVLALLQGGAAGHSRPRSAGR